MVDVHAIIASARAPPSTHPGFPVIAGTPAVLVDVPDELTCAVPLELPPELDVFEDDPDVRVATGPLVVVEGTAELGELPVLAAAPAVMTTGI